MCTPFLERSSSLPPDAILPPYPPDQHVTESAVAQAGNDALPAVESGIKDLKRRQTQSQFPTPFDGGMGNNFTSSSCPLFFNNFLNDPNFQQCHAISLLLVTSQTFFQTSRHADSLNQLLDASCSADFNQCESIMNSYANQLRSQGGCGADYNAQNPNVLEAWQGFLAYGEVYNATCLRSSQNNDYCFTDAVTNSSSPTSSYIYYLPLGISLPNGIMPTCNQCLADTMNNYAPSAGNGTQPISSVFRTAVNQVDQACGSKIVTAAIPNVTGAADRTRSSQILLVSLLIAVFTIIW